MVSIILCASDEAKKLAIAAGFKERTVLIRQECCMSTEEEKQKREYELMHEIHPYQFLVSDYWGAGPD